MGPENEPHVERRMLAILHREWHRARAWPRSIRYGSATVIVLIALFYIAVYQAPGEFVSGKVITIVEGATLSEVAAYLEQEHIVRSAFWLQSIATAFGGEHTVKAGDYYFSRRKNLWSVTRMIITGDFGLEPLRVTIPEGASVRDIASILSNYSSVFDTEKFIELASEREGYLFPDTYFFLPNVSERRVIGVLSDTFLKRIQEVSDEIIAFGRPVDEVITMASILEREAYMSETRRIIAGILWRRIEIGMPLQVDAAFDYINGKNTFELSLDDLREDSPYNTYRNIGLPPTPITNPGLDAIKAAVMPIESDYLYFLSDRNGTTHYSKTFEEHKRKKELYLN